jgi:hypothetical protein
MHSEPSSLSAVASAYGLTDEQVAEMRRGKVVGGELEAVSDNELALSFAFLSKLPVEGHIDRLDRGITSDPAILASGELTGDGGESLAQLVLPDAELDRLAEVEAGRDANFSSEEIASLRAAGSSSQDAVARRAALQAAFRDLLAGRFQAYRARGLAGIVSYDRGDGKLSSPAEQLARAFGEIHVAKVDAPGVYAAMSNFPAAPAAGVRAAFHWIMHSAEDRVVVALSHRVHGIHEGRVTAIDRRFYVSQSLNAMQAIATAIPVDEGTAVFYANRTGTDRITGLGSTIAKKVGRVIMRGQLEGLTEAFRKDTEGPN